MNNYLFNFKKAKRDMKIFSSVSIKKNFSNDDIANYCYKINEKIQLKIQQNSTKCPKNITFGYVPKQIILKILGTPKTSYYTFSNINGEENQYEIWNYKFENCFPKFLNVKKNYNCGEIKYTGTIEKIEFCYSNLDETLAFKFEFNLLYFKISNGEWYCSP
jgi:hypothetical protein